MVRTFQIAAKFGRSCLSFGSTYRALNLEMVFRVNAGELEEITDSLADNDSFPEDKYLTHM